MVVLVAPQEFKGTLTASEAADAIAAGAREALPGAELLLVPMSDGGPGLVEALLTAVGGERAMTRAHDPLMRPVDASWALLADGRAAIEMAAASGLILLAPNELDPLRATTYGTGELLRAALARDCSEIIVGVGGSATVDAGAGALQAVGAHLRDARGEELPPGGAALAALEHIDLSGIDPRLLDTRLRVASDVRNRLCGPKGAAAVFGPQKGASPDDVRVLDAALAHFAAISLRDVGVDLTSVHGGGAAGGLAAGLNLVGASIKPGFDLVSEIVGLEQQIARADLVLTGEGRLDDQTPYGKTAAGVAALARKHNKPVAAIAGQITSKRAAALFDVAVSASSTDISPVDAMRNARTLVEGAAKRAMRELSERYSASR